MRSIGGAVPAVGARAGDAADSRAELGGGPPEGPDEDTVANQIFACRGGAGVVESEARELSDPRGVEGDVQVREP